METILSGIDIKGIVEIYLQQQGDIFIPFSFLSQAKWETIHF